MDFMKKMTFSELERAMTAARLVGEKLYGIIVFTRAPRAPRPHAVAPRSAGRRHRRQRR